MMTTVEPTVIHCTTRPRADKAARTEAELFAKDGVSVRQTITEVEARGRGGVPFTDYVVTTTPVEAC